MSETETAILKRLENIEAMLKRLLIMKGERITREQFRLRLGSIDPKTFKKRMDMGLIPRPQPDGKWFLSEVVEWEARISRHF